jgi:hypothetical protein
MLKNITAVMLCVITYYMIKENEKFYNRLALTLYLPPLVPLIFGIVYVYDSQLYSSMAELIAGDDKSLEADLALFAPGYRFQGLASNPAQVALSSLVGISFMQVLMMYSLRKGRYVFSSICLAAIVGMALLILWSMTRAAIIALFAVILSGLSMTLYQMNRGEGGVGSYLLWIGGLMSMVVATLFLLPSEVVEELFGRFGEETGRLNLWAYYLDVWFSNPLGVGWNYLQRFVVRGEFDPDRLLNMHNAVLDVVVHAGIGGAICILGFVVTIGNSIRKQLQGRDFQFSATYGLGASSAFVGLWCFSLFGGLPIPEFLHSVVVAMILAGVAKHKVHRHD